MIFLPFKVHLQFYIESIFATTNVQAILDSPPKLNPSWKRGGQLHSADVFATCAVVTNSSQRLVVLVF